MFSTMMMNTRPIARLEKAAALLRVATAHYVTSVADAYYELCLQMQQQPLMLHSEVHVRQSGEMMSDYLGC
jgi:hypothetical protein